MGVKISDPPNVKCGYGILLLFGWGGVVFLFVCLGFWWVLGGFVFVWFGLGFFCVFLCLGGGCLIWAFCVCLFVCLWVIFEELF